MQNLFVLKKRTLIDSLGVEVEEYSHKESGAQHIHLSSPNRENVFLLGIKLNQENSKGIPHILEHMILNGSKKYPVKNIVNNLKNRSLCRVASAFTSSDHTCFHFTTQDRIDFKNLLDVYLDAVFNPLLDPIDFSREGHRISFDNPNDIGSKLVHTGVVFNEMRSLMSSEYFQLWKVICRHIFPKSSYQHVNGGDPSQIINATYEDIMGFYKKNYIPANMVFTTFGDLPPENHQIQMQSYLNQFNIFKEGLFLGKEERFSKPKVVLDTIDLGNVFNKDQEYFIMAWLLGEKMDIEEAIKSIFLEKILSDLNELPISNHYDSNKTLFKGLNINGNNESHQELVYILGIKSEISLSDVECENILINQLKEMSKKKFSTDYLRSILEEIEIDELEVGGELEPYGLRLLVTILPGALYEGNIPQLIDIQSVINKIRKDIQQDDFIKNMLDEMLINNNHRISLSLKTSSDSNEVKGKAYCDISKLGENLTKLRNKIQFDNKKISTISNANVKLLPLVTLTSYMDTTRYLQSIESEVRTGLCERTLFFPYTNNVNYTHAIIHFPEITIHEALLLPLLCDWISFISTKNNDNKIAIDDANNKTCPLSCTYSIKADEHNVMSFVGYLSLSGSALSQNINSLVDTLFSVLSSGVLKNISEFKRIIIQHRKNIEDKMFYDQLYYLKLASKTIFHPSAQLNHYLNGFGYADTIFWLESNLDNDEVINKYVSNINQLFNRLINIKPDFLLVGSQKSLEKIDKRLCEAVSKESYMENKSTMQSIKLPLFQEYSKSAWYVKADTNCCAKTFKTVSLSHYDAPSLTVLAEYLNNKYLIPWCRSVRSVYKTGVEQDLEMGTFTFWTYRDPHISRAFCDFNDSIQKFLSNNHKAGDIESSKIAVMKKYLIETSPHKKVSDIYYQNIQQVTHDVLVKFQSSLAQVTLYDMMKVCKKYLLTNKSQKSVITSELFEQEIIGLSFQINKIGKSVNYDTFLSVI